MEEIKPFNKDSIIIRGLSWWTSDTELIELMVQKGQIPLDEIVLGNIVIQYL
jgi:hypothetical protein